MTILHNASDLELKTPFTNYVITLYDAVFKATIENMLNGLYFAPAIFVSQLTTNLVAKEYYEPGLLSTLKGFDSSDASADIFNKSFLGNACEYYDSVYNQSLHGLQMEKCTEIFSGRLKNVSVALISRVCRFRFNTLPTLKI